MINELIKHNTGLNDHTGKEIKLNDTCTLDSGHCDDEDSKGVIVFQKGSFWFKYNSDGDEVLLSNVSNELEINK